MKLMGKVFLDGIIKAVTGLHIGGSKTDVSIGDIDNNVIKTSEGVPYIPGSSLKGKLRSLLEKREENHNIVCEREDCNVCIIFGTPADKRTAKLGPTRLIVRDCYLTEETRRKMENREGEFRELDLLYTESKWENVIYRLTSKADNPRQLERVPQGAEFNFQFVFNIMEDKDVDRLDDLLQGLSLLEDDYLGGNGSRGCGRIKFEKLQIAIKTIKDYEGKNEPAVLYSGSLSTFGQEKYEKIKQAIRKRISEDQGLNN